MRTVHLVRTIVLGLAALAGLAGPALTEVAAAGMVCVSYEYHPNLAQGYPGGSLWGLSLPDG